MNKSAVITKPWRSLLILLWLTACVPNILVTGKPTESVLLTSSPTQAILSTSTPSPTLSPTPWPTLPIDQVVGNVVELLKTNAGCQLPCIWGITPGVTSWVEAEQQLQQAGIQTASYHQGTSLIHYDTLLIPSITTATNVFTKVEFSEQDGAVTSIHLYGEGFSSPGEFKEIWSSYAPERIIPTLGQPTRVWIDAVASAAEGPPTSFPYELWVFYDQLGLLLRYQGTVDARPVYRFCPTFSDSGNIGITMDVYAVSTLGGNSPEDLTELKGMAFPPRNLEEAAGLTIEEFYGLFLKNDQPICFETPRNIWK
jgi:hypothetical protein